MANIRVNVESSTVGSQHIAGRDIHIQYTYQQKRDKSEPVEFNVPRPVQSFRGRDSELAQLNTWFFMEDKPIVAICGLPGYGKTQLANYFIRHCTENKVIQNILWINSETKSSLHHSFRELLKWLGESTDLDIKCTVQKVYEHFSDQSSLFVFDNARDRQSIRDFESTGKSLCLITSHVKDWDDDVMSLPLSPLTLDAALEVLRAVLQTRFQEDNVAEYQQLANVLSRVPLALQIAGAYVRQEMVDLRDAFSLREYVEGLTVSCEQYLDKPMPEFSANTYNVSIFESVKKSIHKIQSVNNNKSNLALNVLHICAYLNPDKIVSSDVLKFPCVNKLCSEKFLDLNRALSLLENYSFVSVHNDQIIIHRLVQDILVLYQSQVITKFSNPIYYSCLEILLADIFNIHSSFILKFAEKHMKTFINFYELHKTDILSTHMFLTLLIALDCKIYLDYIFVDLGDQAVSIIDTHCLLHEALWCDRYDMLQQFLARGADVDQQNKRGDTSLIAAARKLDLHAAQLLVEHGADICAITARGESILHTVIYASGDPQFLATQELANKMVRWLAEHGALLNAVTPLGETLLHKAAYANNADMVHLLALEYQMDVHAVDGQDRTPLYYVNGRWGLDRGRKQRTAESLLEHGARVDIVDKDGKSPVQYMRSRDLEYLARYLENPSQGFEDDHNSQDADVLRALIAAGEINDLTKKLNDLGQCAAELINENCLLQEAVIQGQYNVLKLLLDYNPDVNRIGENNFTALYMAITGLNVQAVQLLVNSGAEVNEIYKSGTTALQTLMYTSGASQNRDCFNVVREILQWLVDNGAHINATSSQGWTLLHIAAGTFNAQVIDFLVREYQMDVHAVDLIGHTPLFYVSYGESVESFHEAERINTAQCLLGHGALIDLVNLLGQTPAQVARNRGYEQLAAFLENPEAWQRSDADADKAATSSARTWCQRLKQAWARLKCTFKTDV